MPKCEICGVEGKPPFIIKHKRIQYLCVKHRAQIRVMGKFYERTVFDKNDYVINGSVAEIKLYNRKHQHIDTTLIDTDDLERVKPFKWYLSKRGYAETIVTGNLHIKLHIFILGRVKNKEIDHINRNPLDNRKSNLRQVSHQENLLNSHRSKQFVN